MGKLCFEYGLVAKQIYFVKKKNSIKINVGTLNSWSQLDESENKWDIFYHLYRPWYLITYILGLTMGFLSPKIHMELLWRFVRWMKMSELRHCWVLLIRLFQISSKIIPMVESFSAWIQRILICWGDYGDFSLVAVFLQLLLNFAQLFKSKSSLQTSLCKAKIQMQKRIHAPNGWKSFSYVSPSMRWWQQLGLAFAVFVSAIHFHRQHHLYCTTNAPSFSMKSTVRYVNITANRWFLSVCIIQSMSTIFNDWNQQFISMIVLFRAHALSILCLFEVKICVYIHFHLVNNFRLEIVPFEWFYE